MNNIYYQSKDEGIAKVVLYANDDHIFIMGDDEVYQLFLDRECTEKIDLFELLELLKKDKVLVGNPSLPIGGTETYDMPLRFVFLPGEGDEGPITWFESSDNVYGSNYVKGEPGPGPEPEKDSVLFYGLHFENDEPVYTKLFEDDPTPYTPGEEVVFPSKDDVKDTEWYLDPDLDVNAVTGWFEYAGDGSESELTSDDELTSITPEAGTTGDIKFVMFAYKDGPQPN